MIILKHVQANHHFLSYVFSSGSFGVDTEGEILIWFLLDNNVCSLCWWLFSVYDAPEALLSPLTYPPPRLHRPTLTEALQRSQYYGRHLENIRHHRKMLCYTEMNKTVSLIFKNSQFNGEGRHISRYLHFKLSLIYETGKHLKDFGVLIYYRLLETIKLRHGEVKSLA